MRPAQTNQPCIRLDGLSLEQGKLKGRKGSHPSHNWAHEKGQALPVVPHVGFRQLNSNSENPYCEHDAGEFKCDSIRHSFRCAGPLAWIEYISAVWTWMGLCE